MSGQPQDPVRTAQGLTAALQGLTERLAEVKADSEARDAGLKRYGRLNRAAVVLDILLTLAIAGVGWWAHDASSATAQLRDASAVSCRNTNVARDESRKLWDHLIDLSVAAPRSATQTAAQKAAQVKELDGLRAYVATVYRHRDCSIFSGH